MGMRCSLAFVACSLMLSACQSTEDVWSSGDDGNCISHYEEVAQASGLSVLKAELRNDVLPSLRSLVTLENKPD